MSLPVHLNVPVPVPVLLTLPRLLLQLLPCQPCLLLLLLHFAALAG
jgi:hypothetical protein